MKRMALGRGLDSLISMDDAPAAGSSAINEIEIDKIEANKEQPRRTFDDESLEELASSIAEIGIIQPLSLRPMADGRYQIIAGERRFRAAKLAGLERVPAYIRPASEMEVTEMALIENIQRQDLNPIEISLAFKKLMETYGLTQEKLSDRIGKNRATIANFLRLIKLPADVQLGLRDRLINMGHARALLGIDDPSRQLKIYHRILKEGLSVRQVENLASHKENKTKTGGAYKNEYADMARQLTNRFLVPVDFKMGKSGKGKIIFSFTNPAELGKLIATFDAVKP